MTTYNDLISKLFPDDWFSRLVYAGGAVIFVGLGSHIVYEVVKSSRKQKSVDVILKSLMIFIRFSIFS